MNEKCNYLLSRCALKDYESFKQLYNLASPKLFAVAMRILSKKELSEEVLQEAMIKIWNKASSYRPDLSNAMTWMTRIVRNQALDYLRSQKRMHATIDPNVEWESLEQLLNGDDSEEDHNDPILKRAMQKCLDSIQAQQKQCISMIYFFGNTYKEIATTLDKPIGTVKVWVHRGLEDLRKCLDQ
jgi:RNA polymerase sigma-70 factor, ECF subfamily